MEKLIKDYGIRSFYLQRKASIFFVSFFGLLIYIPKIANFSYSIDSEVLATDPNEIMFSWIRIGRFGLVFLKRFFLYGINLNPFFINLTTYLLFTLSGVLILYMINALHPSDPFIGNLGTLVYLSSPIHFEQTNFILQSTEVMIAYNLLFLSIILIGLPGTKVKRSHLLLGLAFAIFSFSIYPSLIIAFIALSVIATHISLIGEPSLDFSFVFQQVKKYAVSFIVCLTSYFILNRVVLSAWHVKADTYVTGKSLWGQAPILDILCSIIRQLKTFILPNQPFNLEATTLLAFCAFIGFLIVGIKRKKICFLVLSCIVIEYLIAILPMLLLATSVGPVRALTPAIPLILMSYTISLLYLFQPKSLKYLMGSIAVLAILLQVKTTMDLEQTDIQVYSAETQLSNQIIYRIGEAGISDYTKYKLIIIGQKSFMTPLTTLGDVIGYSHYNWDGGTPISINGRVHGFLKSQGYSFKEITEQDYRQAAKFVTDTKMKTFPDQRGFYKKGNTIIVNIN